MWMTVNLRIVALICFAVVPYQTLGSSILVLFPHIYYDHFKHTSTLVTELRSRGHDVTFVSPYPGKVEGYRNITEISIEPIIKPIKEFENEFFKNENYWFPYWSKLKYAEQRGYHYSQQILQNENVMELMTSNSSFDLVIIEDVSADGLAVLSYVFNCPLVVLLSDPLSVFYDNYMIDNILWKQHNDLRNAHQWALKELYREWFILPHQNELVKEIVPEAPDLKDILYETSLVLMPSYSTLGNLVPKYTNVKQIGGFHLGTSRQLPSTFGSNFNKSLVVMSNNVPIVVEEMFRDIYNRGAIGTVLLKKGVSKIREFPNVKLFIGDGDVYDTALAISQKVPVLSIANTIWDQQFLTDSLVEQKLAAKLYMERLSLYDLFITTQDFFFDNARCKEDLKQVAEIIQWQKTSPMEEAIFWIEYVIKFDGAPHLRPRKLQWTIQNHLIIIIIVLTLADVALFLLFYWIIKHFPKWLRYCGRKIHSGIEVLFHRNVTSISYIKL